MIRAALTCALAVLLILTIAPAHGDDAEGLDVDRAHWKTLDAESKWALYRERTRGENRDDPRAWHAFLADERDYTLLEWAAVYEGWTGPGDVLVSRGAPQWMRCAIWALASQNSHEFESAAMNAIRAHPGAALGYAEKYPAVLLDAWFKGTVAQWREAGVKPEDPDPLLAPLTPREVYAHLFAPEQLAALTPAGQTPSTRLETGTRFVHQVTRAIDGLVRSNRQTPEAMQQLERLTNHRSADVRHAACLAYSRLPSYQVPYTAMLYLAGDPSQPDRVREAALFAFGRTDHPAVVGKLIAIANEVDHPAWRAAVVRVVDKRDGFALRFLNAQAKASLGTPTGDFLIKELERLQAAEAAVSPKQRASGIGARIERGAWFTLSGQSFAADYGRFVLEAGSVSEPALVQEIRRLQAEYEPGPELFDRRFWRDPVHPAPSREQLVGLVVKTLRSLDPSTR